MDDVRPDRVVNVIIPTQYQITFKAEQGRKILVKQSLCMTWTETTVTVGFIQAKHSNLREELFLLNGFSQIVIDFKV